MSEETMKKDDVQAGNDPSEEKRDSSVSHAEESNESGKTVKLNSLYLFKEGMGTVFNENNIAVTVTVLRYEPLVVSQIKTPENDGYSAVQVACRPLKSKKAKAPDVGHFSKFGWQTGASIVREVRQPITEDVKLGLRVAIDSLAKGDCVKMTSKSKGRGFAGVVKRYNFAGGRASHGSKFHRRPGSIGNCEWPGRVMPGRKLPGHMGNKNITVKHVQVYDVIPEENVIMVVGPVPGARNSIVKLVKE